MRYGFINNFSQLLAADLSAGATTLTLDGGGSLLSNASAELVYTLTLDDGEGTVEIVHVTGGSGNDLTVERGKEGTTDAAWPTGSTVEMRLTAGVAGNFSQQSEVIGSAQPSASQAAIMSAELSLTSTLNAVSISSPTNTVFYADGIDIIRTVDTVDSPSIVLVGHEGGSGFSAFDMETWSIISGTPTFYEAEGVAKSPTQPHVAIAPYDLSEYVTVYSTVDWSVVNATTLTYANDVQFSPDGAHLAVARGVLDGNEYLHVFDTSDWTEVAVPTVPGNAGTVAWSNDGSMLAVAHDSGDYLTVIETATWTKITVAATIPGIGWTCVFSPDDSELVVGHSSGSNMTVIDTSDWSVVAGTPSLSGIVFGLGFNSDGSLLAVGYNGGSNFSVFDTSDWSAVSGTPSIPERVWACKFSTDDSQVLIGYLNGGMRVYNVSDWSQVTGTPSLPDSANAFAFIEGGPPPPAKISIGTDGSPTAIASDLEVSTNLAGDRQTITTPGVAGTSSLGVTIDTANSDAGAVRIVAKGYVMEL